MRDVNGCIRYIEMRYQRRVQFTGIILLYSHSNKTTNIQEDEKFRGLCEYVVTFLKVYCFGNNILKMQSETYFFQEYICMYVYCMCMK